MIHKPVLVKEVLEYLKIEDGDRIIDATINGGGHTRAILENFENVRVLGIEYDPEIFKNLTNQFAEESRLLVVNDSYVNLESIVEKYDFQSDGILFDFGVSSWHYEKSGRGFSFLRDELLDMRFNPEVEKLTAAQIVNSWSQAELENLFKSYGEEKFAKQIAENIVHTRRREPILKTSDLVNVVGGSVPEWYKKPARAGGRKIHFATKTFQALRIAVNHELDNVRVGLEKAIKVLKPGGRIAAISFHGLEDKTVKNLFKEKVKEGMLRFVVKGTIKPSWEEQKTNPRSRSAKMKVVEKAG